MGKDSREHDLTPGVLALVVSLSEMIKDVQRIPALELMRDRGLSKDELEGWRARWDKGTFQGSCCAARIKA